MRLWLALHGWLTLPVWAFLFFIFLTGSIATVSDEITWLVEPAARAVPASPVSGKLGYDEIVRGVGDQAPEMTITMIGIPEMGRSALQVYVTLPGGGERTLYVNPYTGGIQGQKSTFDLKQFLVALHGWILVPFTSTYSFGWYLVTAMSVPLLGSVITGLIVYKKFWRAILRPRLRMRNGSRIFLGDFHRLAGLWSVPFILIISISAMWFLARAIIEDSGFTLPGHRTIPQVEQIETRTEEPRDDGRSVTIDEAIAIVGGNFRHFQPTFIVRPANPHAPLAIWGRSTNPLLLTTVYIDPFSGAVLNVHSADTSTAVQLLTESMHPLHTGSFAGLWLKLVYVFFGLVLTLISLSGMLIWAKRTLSATSKAFKNN